MSKRSWAAVGLFIAAAVLVTRTVLVGFHVLPGAVSGAVEGFIYLIGLVCFVFGLRLATGQPPRDRSR